jgi:hypothetical protein
VCYVRVRTVYYVRVKPRHDDYRRGDYPRYSRVSNYGMPRYAENPFGRTAIPISIDAAGCHCG